MFTSHTSVYVGFMTFYISNAFVQVCACVCVSGVWVFVLILQACVLWSFRDTDFFFTKTMNNKCLSSFRILVFHDNGFWYIHFYQKKGVYVTCKNYFKNKKQVCITPVSCLSFWLLFLFRITIKWFNPCVWIEEFWSLNFIWIFFW